jgi:hypothetical protein
MTIIKTLSWMIHQPSPLSKMLYTIITMLEIAQIILCCFGGSMILTITSSICWLITTFCYFKSYNHIYELYLVKLDEDTSPEELGKYYEILDYYEETDLYLVSKIEEG